MIFQRNIRTTILIENYNGILLKITNNKKILTLTEYINLLVSEEHRYKMKILNIESKSIDNEVNVTKLIAEKNNNLNKSINKYFLLGKIFLVVLILFVLYWYIN